MTYDPPVRPFVPEITPEAIADLSERMGRSRWPEAATEPGAETQGPRVEDLRRLAAYWIGGYDWGRFADLVTSPPQVLTPIDGVDVHAIHAPSPRPDAVPLLLTHGWPSTCFEFTRLLPILNGTENDDGPAFHVVCPSLPGYGWSGKPAEAGWGADRIADAWAELMSRLGYDRFIASGGDWGAIVSTEVAIRHPDRLLGLHLTMPIARTSDDDRGALSQAEERGLAREADYRRDGFAYALVQLTRPQTIGYGLVDSPLALLAWIAEKLRAWSGHDQDGAPLLSDDDLLDVVGVYWFTATGASSARLYREALRMDSGTPVHVPTGCSIFADEIIRPPRRAVERRYRNLVSWQEVPIGGHFAALEVPGLFAEQLRAFAHTLDMD